MVADGGERGNGGALALRQGIAVIGRFNLDADNQFAVLQPGADALINLAEIQVGGQQRGEAVDVAVVDDLEKFFTRPICRVLRAEVIQHQKAHPADFLKALLEGGLIRTVAEAQPIQQVGHRQEERRDAHRDHFSGNRGSQVGFPCAETAHQQQPTVEMSGVISGGVESGLQDFMGLLPTGPAGQVERIKGHCSVSVQVADLIEAAVTGFLDFRALAFAHFQLAEVGVVDWQDTANIADPTAFGAYVWIKQNPL